MCIHMSTRVCHLFNFLNPARFWIIYDHVVTQLLTIWKYFNRIFSNLNPIDFVQVAIKNVVLLCRQGCQTYIHSMLLSHCFYSSLFMNVFYLSRYAIIVVFNEFFLIIRFHKNTIELSSNWFFVENSTCTNLKVVLMKAILVNTRRKNSCISWFS